MFGEYWIKTDFWEFVHDSLTVLSVWENILICTQKCHDIGQSNVIISRIWVLLLLKEYAVFNVLDYLQIPCRRFLLFKARYLFMSLM